MVDNNKKAYSIRKCSLLNLVGRNAIRVPKIQRDYAQGRDNDIVNDIRSKFVHDLITAISPSGSPIELDFVYGSFRDDAFEPLDGQQRLTTLFLLHWICGVDLYDKERDSSKLSYETRSTSTDFCLELVKHSPKQFLEEIAQSLSHKNEQIEKAKKALIALQNISKDERPEDYPKLIESAKKALTDAEKLPEKSFSSLIQNRDWFNYLWKFDPTIQSMLVMLDALHKEFLSRHIDIDSCKANLERITFSDLDLGDFDLSDDLFIKMNARGKQLSSFDILKSSLEEEIQIQKAEGHCTTICESNWRSLIDGEWIDWFWNMYASSQIGEITAPEEEYKERLNLAKISEENLKRLILRCISLRFVRNDSLNTTFADYCYKDQIENLNRLLIVYNDALRDLRSKGKVPERITEISFPDVISDIKALYYKDSDDVYRDLLSLIPEKYNINSRDTSLSYLTLFLGDKCNNDSKIVFYALLKYAQLRPIELINGTPSEQWIDNFIEWAHFVRNLFMNENNNVKIDDAAIFKSALGGVDKVLDKLKDYIDKHPVYSTLGFIDSLRGLTFTGVDNQSLAEETEKAFLKLSDSGDWKRLLDSAESHYYLWGQVRCLLSWAARDIDLFKDYYQRLSDLFAYEDKNLVYAGIMSIDPSYGFANNKLYQFTNKHRDYGFKRFLRDESIKEKSGVYAPAVKATLDKWRKDFSSHNLKEFLTNVISQSLSTGHSYVNCILAMPNILDDAKEKMIFQSDGHYVIAQWKTINSHCYDIALEYLYYYYLESEKLSGDITFYDSVAQTYKHAIMIPHERGRILIKETANGGYDLSINDSSVITFPNEKVMLDTVIKDYPS
jgi:hypothetical protein